MREAIWRGVVALALLVMGGLPAASGADQPPLQAPTGTPLREQGLVGTWYPPASAGRAPAILVLGGSEGGTASSARLGAVLAAQGYAVLGLAYFKTEGLPPKLVDLPLDYFDRAIAWLRANPQVDPARIGVFGISKGGEAALLVAARNPGVKAVAAAVPSSVVWPGIDPENYLRMTSSWSLDGASLPYLPFDRSVAFTSVYDLYARALAKAGAHPDAEIPVERIAGPVLLLSAKDDRLWPSTAMADAVIKRLDARRFAFAHRHLAFADAGHGAFVPRPAPVDNSGYANLGGTDAGNAAARAQGWSAILAFFADALGKAR